MLAEFFYKKKFGCFVCAIVLTFIFGCVAYARYFVGIKSVDVDETFYFLVRKDAGIEASAELVRWDGGAGYFIEEGGSEYVAINVFLKKEEAELVQKRLSLKGASTTILQKRIQKLYFKGRKKEQATLYVAALNLFKSYMIVLEECITRLENGLTQEACKRILKTLEKQFRYVEKTCDGYLQMQKACSVISSVVSQMCSTTVYLKDLRYLLCWQAEKYIQLSGAFAL